MLTFLNINVIVKLLIMNENGDVKDFDLEFNGALTKFNDKEASEI